MPSLFDLLCYLSLLSNGSSSLEVVERMKPNQATKKTRTGSQVQAKQYRRPRALRQTHSRASPPWHRDFLFCSKLSSLSEGMRIGKDQWMKLVPSNQNAMRSIDRNCQRTSSASMLLHLQFEPRRVAESLVWLCCHIQINHPWERPESRVWIRASESLIQSTRRIPRPV